MNPTHKPKRFDHILLGTGQATGTLISGLPEHVSIAVIEKGDVGGSCVNYGCTPSKTLIASARVAHLASRADTYGVHIENVETHFAAVIERVNAIRHGSRDGLTGMLERDSRVSLYRGRGQFLGPNAIEVDGHAIEGDTIHINVGTKSRLPDLKGLNETPYLTPNTVFDLDQQPSDLVVLGGSYVGLEMAQAFQRFGTNVTVLEAGPRIIAREDADVSNALHEVLTSEGVRIETNARAQSVEATSEGVQVTLTDGRHVTGSNLLVATGRVPNTAELGLDRAGVATDERGFIDVDEHGQTNVPGVYALGDVNGRGAFTHTSVHDAQVVLDHLSGGPRRINDRVLTYALFVDPPLGRVGLNENQAEAAGLKVRVAKREMKRIARAKEMGETQGFIKILIDEGTEKLVGVTAFGLYGDEIANLFALALQQGATAEDLRRTVFIHPTVAELLPFMV
jgi:pyruvate/2-oxoglutarate dehydrogenase complex dihydrolipoamide dehydrogenase (E3) component